MPRGAQDQPRPEDEDAGLVRRAREGNQEALGRLTEKYTNRMRVTVLYALGLLLRDHVDRDHVDAVLQEVMGRIPKALAGIRKPGAFKAWVVTYTRNTARDWVRKHVRQTAAVSLEKMMESGFQPEARTTEPSRVRGFSFADLAPLIARCLKGLSSEMHDAILWRFNMSVSSVSDDENPLTVHGDSVPYAQIAEERGRKENTLRSWVKRGLDQLRDCLRGCLGD